MAAAFAGQSGMSYMAILSGQRIVIVGHARKPPAQHLPHGLAS